MTCDVNNAVMLVELVPVPAPWICRPSQQWHHILEHQLSGDTQAERDGRAGSQLVDNAIRMIDRCSAILREPLPLEGGAEGAHFLLLILLLFSEFHENLTPKQYGFFKYSNSN